MPSRNRSGAANPIQKTRRKRRGEDYSYIQRTDDEIRSLNRKLQEAKDRIRSRYRMAALANVGDRELISCITGQLEGGES